MNLNRYKELDGLRGCAALMVMFFHLMIGYDAANNPVVRVLKKTSIFGQTGVTLFFVLSGFLITRILLQTKPSKVYFKNFYIKRSLRIFPLYYFSLILYYILDPWIFNESYAQQSSRWIYFVYLQNFADTFDWKSSGPQTFWSLAVEEHFYLFWPFIVYYSSVKGLVKASIGLILFSFICRIILISLGYGTFYFTFTTIDCLAIGGLLAVSEKENIFTYKHFKLITIISLPLLCIFWLWLGGAGNNIVQCFKLPIIAFFYMGLIGLLITNKNWLNIPFNSRLLRFTGKISYGLYVFHPWVAAAIGRYLHLGNGIIQFLITVLTCYAVAAISYYTLEISFLRLKEKYTNSEKTEDKMNLSSLQVD